MHQGAATGLHPPLGVGLLSTLRDHIRLRTRGKSTGKQTTKFPKQFCQGHVCTRENAPNSRHTVVDPLNVDTASLGSYGWTNGSLRHAGPISNVGTYFSQVFLAVLRAKHMHTVTNLFILNLAASDIVMCLFSVPFTPLQSFTGKWYFGETM